MNIDTWKRIHNVEVVVDEYEDDSLRFHVKANLYALSIDENGFGKYELVASEATYSSSREKAEFTAIEMICEEAGIQSPYRR